MNYDEALRFIHSESWTKHKNGLNRIRELLGLLGDPQEALRFVHVAGTNGKGSTCAMLDSVLRAAGYHVGLFTSPFLECFRERIRVDGEMIGEEALARITDTVRTAAEKMTEKPSEFEVITAIGMVWFKLCACDVVVLEVGLGGEFDSTNVIRAPLCSVITAIGFDHMSMLGNTIAEIASAKAGIIKKDCPVVTASGDGEANRVFEKKALEMNAPLMEADTDSVEILKSTPRGSVFKYRGSEWSLPLAGSFQPKNAALAISALEVLVSRGMRIPPEAIREGISTVLWPGRLELLSEAPTVLLDGGHNAHGIAAAVRSVDDWFPRRNLRTVVCVMRDKNVDEMLELLLKSTEKVYACSIDYARALPAAELAETVRRLGGKAEACDSVFDAVQHAMRDAGPDGAVLAIGSLYMSAEVRRSVKEIAQYRTR